MVYVSWFMVYGGFRLQGLEYIFYGSWFMVRGLGFKV
jgi:hypothetical protein